MIRFDSKCLYAFERLMGGARDLNLRRAFNNRHRNPAVFESLVKERLLNGGKMQLYDEDLPQIQQFSEHAEFIVVDPSAEQLVKKSLQLNDAFSFENRGEIYIKLNEYKTINDIKTALNLAYGHDILAHVKFVNITMITIPDKEARTEIWKRYSTRR